MFSIYCEGWNTEFVFNPAKLAEVRPVGFVHAMSESNGEIWEGTPLQIGRIVVEALTCESLNNGWFLVGSEEV